MSPLLAFFGVGPTELMVVAGIVLLLFGHRMPRVMKDLARGIKEFQHGLREPVLIPQRDDPSEGAQ
jgi:TatA/E family protein of Tat protein translocase